MRVHAQLDDLERDAAAHRLLLLGHVDHAAAAFADLLEQLVAADPVPRGLLEPLHSGRRLVLAEAIIRSFEESSGGLVRAEEVFDPVAQYRVRTAGLREINVSRRRIVFFQCFDENGPQRVASIIHSVGLPPQWAGRAFPIMRNPERKGAKRGTAIELDSGAEKSS